MEYRSRRMTVKAFRVTHETASRKPNWLDWLVKAHEDRRFGVTEKGHVWISDRKSRTRVQTGEWILHANGAFGIMPDAMFRMSFDPVPDLPKKPDCGSDFGPD